MDKKISITLIIAISALIAIYIITTSINPSSSETISVSGNSQIDVTPDLITTYFTIENKAEKADEAQRLTSEIYNNLVKSLNSIGIEESKIKTTNINIYPNYEWINNRNVQKGFKATHNIKIELPTEEKNKVSDLILKGVESGALINYINFELSEELQKEKKAEATQKATEDAKIKAESIATGLNTKLGKIVSVSDSGFEYYPRTFFERNEAVSSASVAGDAALEKAQNINPSEQTVSANVQVVYRIR